MSFLNLILFFSSTISWVQGSYLTGINQIYRQQHLPKNVFLNEKLWIKNGFHMLNLIEEMPNKSWKLSFKERSQHFFYISIMNFSEKINFKNQITTWLGEFILLGYKPQRYEIKPHLGSLVREHIIIEIVKSSDQSYWYQELFHQNSSKNQIVSLLYPEAISAQIQAVREHIQWKE